MAYFSGDVQSAGTSYNTVLLNNTNVSFDPNPLRVRRSEACLATPHVEVTKETGFSQLQVIQEKARGMVLFSTLLRM